MFQETRVKKNLGWKELKALNDLYVHKKTQAKIQGSGYIKYLIDDKGLIERKIGNSKVLLPTGNYNQFYETYLKENYYYYKIFFETTELSSDARKNYTEYDIRTLMFIKENKEEIVRKLSNIRLFSSYIFQGKGSKYLENKKGLVREVCKILGITEFPDDGKTENQWRFVVDCLNPKATIICENLTFLKAPWQAKKNNLKLWYVGGNNIGVLDDIDQEELNRPIYYSGDWDLAGLQIYSRVKQKFKDKGKDITLLYPNLPHNPLPTYSPHHKSKWNYDLPFSGLDLEVFKGNETPLILTLIAKNEWIEEESNDLIKMIER